MISQNYAGSNIIFIVGCPRSGTTWLRNMLSENSMVKSPGAESHLFDRYLGQLLRRWNEDKKEQRPRGLAGTLDEGIFVRATRDYALRLLDIDALKPDEVFVEKTPQHMSYLPEIMKLFPSSKIIHIIRDPRDVVVSMLAVSKSWASNIEEWKSASRAARRWVDRLSEISSYRELVPQGQFFELKYEDLLSSPMDTMEKLSSHIGLHWSGDSLQQTIKKYDASSLLENKDVGVENRLLRKGLRRGKAGTWKDDLSPLQKLQVWYIARKMMGKFDYGWKYPWSE